MQTYQTQIVKVGELCASDQRLWREWHKANPFLYSPYFSFEYTKIIAAIVEDVHVLKISQGEDTLGFLPFQAKVSSGGSVGFARPIGSPMTDYQGVICALDTAFDLSDILSKAGFGAFHFSSAIEGQGALERFARSTTPCTVMDISMGATAWREAQSSSYRRHLKNNRKRMRKAEDLGPIRTVFQSRDKVVFDQLIAWKREKFMLTGKYDVLGAGWTHTLLERLWQAGSDAPLRADMHALYFGETLAAIDLGLTDGTTFHSWMVAYNSDLQTLAPGIQLLELLIDAANDIGYTRIDLGEGVDGYKRHYATEDIGVLSGFIAASGPAAALSKLYGACENFSERKLGRIGKIPGKARRRYSQISACEPQFSGRAKAMLSAVATSGKA